MAASKSWRISPTLADIQGHIVEGGKLTGMEFDTFTAREENGKLIQEPAGQGSSVAGVGQ